MELLYASLEGYKRFGSRSQVRLDERLIAVIGPNEAGKSTLLRALTHINDLRPFEPRETTRGMAAGPTVSATFALSDEDRKAVSEVIGGPAIKRLTWTKSSGNPPSGSLDPYPRRPISHRTEIVRQVDLVSDYPELARPTAGKPDLLISELTRRIAQPLDTKEETLPGALLADLRELHASLVQLLSETQTVPSAGSEGDAIDEFESNLVQALQRSGVLQGLSDDLARMLTTEEAERPAATAWRILTERLPRFLLFDQSDRDLRSAYNLDEAAVNPPVALANLARLAKLDLPGLLEAATAGDWGRVEHMVETANSTLRDEFSHAWEQSDVTVRLRVDDRTLRILVTLPSGAGYSFIDERSDGLLWFVALFSFLSGRGVASKPILLIDEAEMHLHYDAQADLVQLMVAQELSDRIIYTTHSAGCLPPDLGAGIRLVVPDTGERSHLQNSFWAVGEGFRPLLMAMGASLLAFGALRYALVGEGPVEAILLALLTLPWVPD